MTTPALLRPAHTLELSHGRKRLRPGLAALAVVGLALLGAGRARAQCPEQPPLQNYTGSGTVACPCFVAGEQAGAVLQAPAGDYPLEILRVGIGWGSQFGGNPAQLEQSINIFAGGLPNPGTPIFQLPGPQLTDGVINEFDLEPLPGEITVASGPFTVTLEFLNDNAGDIYAPSVVHDGNGCQAGKNVVFAIPGGWKDACSLGVTGDWVFYVVYRPCVTPTGVGGERVLANTPMWLSQPRPNPSSGRFAFDLVVSRPGPATVAVYDVSGRRVATLVDGSLGTGLRQIAWNGRGQAGPLPSGVYFVRLTVGGVPSQVRKVLLAR